MILYAVLGLLLVAMIVLAVLSARKDWHWLNPVLMVFIFIAGAAGMIGMAQTLHLRRGVLKKISDARERVNRAEEQQQKIIYGDLKSSAYGPESLRGLNQQVELLQLGRGRVWPGGKVANEDGEIKFTFPAEQPEIENEDMSLVNVELFAFATDQNGQSSFVGKFRVIEQTETDLYMEQSVPIANWQEYGNPQAASWTLYERMPFDKHGIFRDLYAHLNPNKPLMTDNQFDISTFRQFLMTNPAAFPAAKLGMDPASAEYERLIDEIAFDQLTIGEIDSWVDSAPNRVEARFEPEPSEVFVRYRFTGDSKETYTVDDKTGKLDTDGTFSVQGHAVDPLLHLSPGTESRDVAFKKDDVIEIDQATAGGYTRGDGTKVVAFDEREPNVEEIGKVYRRKLIDFPYVMTNLYNRGFRTETERGRLSGNNQVQDGTLADLKTQEQDGNKEKIAIQNDNKAIQNDIDVVSSALQQRQQQVEENERKIQQLKSQVDRLRAGIEVRSQNFSSN